MDDTDQATRWASNLEVPTLVAELAAVRAIVDRATTQCGLGAAIAEHFGADLPRTDDVVPPPGAPKSPRWCRPATTSRPTARGCAHDDW